MEPAGRLRYARAAVVKGGAPAAADTTQQYPTSRPILIGVGEGGVHFFSLPDLALLHNVGFPGMNPRLDLFSRALALGCSDDGCARPPTLSDYRLRSLAIVSLAIAFGLRLRLRRRQRAVSNHLTDAPHKVCGHYIFCTIGAIEASVTDMRSSGMRCISRCQISGG